MRIMPKPVMDDPVHSPGQFFSVGVGNELAAFAVGDFSRLERPPMWRGQDNRQVAGKIFNVVAASEIALAGLVLNLGQAIGKDRKPNQASNG